MKMDRASLTREIVVYPAFDKRSSEPSKNYGIHGANITFYLKGPEGIVQFVIFTNWQLPHVRKEGEANKWEPWMWQPMGADVGYHSPKPRYKDQSSMDCGFLPEGKCYYDGSGLMATDMLELLIEKGSEAVWDKLTEFYERNLCTEPEHGMV